MQKKIPFLTYLFFILIYAGQGFSDLPGQSLYYLTRESWHLSATVLGVLAFVTSLAWMIKPVFGLVSDYLGTKKQLKTYLIGNTLMIIVVALYAIIFGFNLVTLVLCLFLMNCAIAGNDVTNDKVMVILEQKYALKGKIQSVQWTALGVAGLVVALAGAWIATSFSNTYNYRVAFAVMLLLPAGLLFYLFRYYKNPKIKATKVKFS